MDTQNPFGAPSEQPVAPTVEQPFDNQPSVQPDLGQQIPTAQPMFEQQPPVQPDFGQQVPQAQPMYEQQPPVQPDFGQQIPPAQPMYEQQPPVQPDYGQQIPPAQPVYGQQPPPYGAQPPYGQPGFQQPPYPMAPPANNGKAVASFILGIASLLLFWAGYGALIALGCGIAGMLLGIQARKEMPPGTAGMATAGMVMSIIGAALAAIVFLACLCIGGALCSSGYYY